MIKLLLCGNYGATNLGDEAILDGIISLVRKVEPGADITVLSSNPDDTQARHGVKSLYLLPAGPRSFIRGLLGGHISKTFAALKECDAFLLGGGGLLTDEKLMAMIIWPLQASFATFLHKPLFCIGQSVGPLRTSFGRMMAKKVYRKAAGSSVRDIPSKQLLRKLGLPAPSVLADPAFLLKSGAATDAKRENFVVFSVRNWPAKHSDMMYNYFAQSIDWLWSEYGFKSILVPFSMSPENDFDVLNKIFAQVKNGEAAEIYEYSGDYRKVLDLMGKAKAVVGMRLHSLIFSAMASTPFVAVSYSDKVTGLCESLDMGDYTIKWADLSDESLKSVFSGLMGNYETISRRLTEKTLLMKRKAGEHEQMLRAFFDSVKNSRAGAP